MSEKEKGAILNQVSKLSPLDKAKALGFMQGLAAASADENRTASTPEPEEEKKEAQEDG